ncbi:MAG: site-2 protease family protein [Cetobacterium sp.]|uniref:site-2 protease family protein n=1 Tax=Cetobacterium TaxID=180162 RepID=UPI001F06D2AF|nr:MULTISPECIES: site-2 protease family protein [Cetobacterium]MCX3067476.1 site-2 protease family protein [Cetobacterium somerae]UPO96966.1 site-2 protease family protein [Cetobacterium somerae]
MIVLKVIILLFSLVLHELAHGYMALFCGDKTAKYSGRLSLNPLKHLDPIGALVPIFMLLSGSNFIIGWAKPVPVNYFAFRNGRVGEFLVSIAGVLTNYLLMILGAILIKYGVVPFNDISIYFIIINMALGTFNLLPIPPLDGSRVIASFLNDENRIKVFTLDTYGILFIIVLSYFGILSKMMSPIYNILVRFIDLIIRS